MSNFQGELYQSEELINTTYEVIEEMNIGFAQMDILKISGEKNGEADLYGILLRRRFIRTNMDSYIPSLQVSATIMFTEE